MFYICTTEIFVQKSNICFSCSIVLMYIVANLFKYLLKFYFYDFWIGTQIINLDIVYFSSSSFLLINETSIYICAFTTYYVHHLFLSRNSFDYFIIFHIIIVYINKDNIINTLWRDSTMLDIQKPSCNFKKENHHKMNHGTRNV